VTVQPSAEASLEEEAPLSNPMRVAAAIPTTLHSVRLKPKEEEGEGVTGEEDGERRCSRSAARKEEEIHCSVM
jgi:hypothetical protein